MNANPSHVARRTIAAGLRALVLTTAAAILAGCYTAHEATVDDMIPGDYRQRHPIVLREAPRSVDLFIGNRRGSLSGIQRAEIVAFAQAWQREATGGILIDVPSGTPNARSAQGALQEVRSILAGVGVPPHAVATRRYIAQDSRKLLTMRLHYPKVMADAGPCGLWPSDLGPTLERQYLENKPYYNLGCSSQRNLAAMVENPTDLVQPRAEIPSYTGRRTMVLEKYRKGESTATVYPDAGKGKISDVGQ